MALIAISVLLLMWNYIVNYKKEKKTEEDVIRPLVRSESPPVPYYYPDTPKKETPMNATPMYETKRPQPAQHKTYYI